MAENALLTLRGYRKRFRRSHVIVLGHKNEVEGNHNRVRGRGCLVIGDDCVVWGDGCTVIGARCRVYGNGCTVVGRGCRLKGSDGEFRGDDGRVSGEGNVIEGKRVRHNGVMRECVLTLPDPLVCRDEEAAGEELRCVVCLANRKCCSFAPCGHMVACVSCVHALYAMGDVLCPVCREGAQGVNYVRY